MAHIASLQKIFLAAGVWFAVTSLPVSAAAATADPQCAGKIDGYFWPSSTPGTHACPGQAAGMQTCTNTYSNYCFDGQTLSVFIYQSCSTATCAMASTGAAPIILASTGTAAPTPAPSPVSKTTPPSPGSTATTTSTPTMPSVPTPTQPTASAPTKPAIAWGVNGHAYYAQSNNGVPDLSTLATIFKTLKQRNLTSYRTGANLAYDTDPYAVADFAQTVSLAKTYGIKLQVVLALPFSWGDRTDHGRYPAGDRDALYQQGFNRTYNFVKNFRNDVTEWELENEINLLNRDASGNPLWGKGWTAAEFDTPTMNDWASLLRGMSDAIDKINLQHGLHLRKILNTTSTMFGFLDFMASRGVEFDVISYHYYESEDTNPHNYWGGVRPNFDLFKELAAYHKSVLFNEVNCSEIYNANFENTVGQPLTEKCFRSFNKNLDYIKTQTDAPIEAVNAYELLDEPQKQGAERYFGLMYDLNTPKVELYIATKYAGGALTPAESQELAKRGF